MFVQVAFAVAIACAVVSDDVDQKAPPDQSGITQDSPAQNAAKDAIINRLGKLRRLSITFKSHETYTPMAGLKEQLEAANVPGARRKLKTGSFNKDCTFRYLDGKYWYETKLIPDDLAAAAAKFEMQDQTECYFGRGFERYHKQRDVGDGMGSIQASPEQIMLRPRQLVDVGLGVRMVQDRVYDWLTPDEIRKMSIEIKPDGLVELSHTEAKSERLHTWQFDPAEGYALRKYTVFFIGSKDKELEVEVSNVQIGNAVFVPSVVELRQFGAGENGNQAIIYRNTLDNLSYELDAPDNMEEAYHITWPVGTSVYHVPSGRTIRIKTGPQILDEKRLQEILARPDNRGRP